MIYNTQQFLWDNYYASNPDAHIRVQDGHIIINNNILACCKNTIAAIVLLKIAGYPAAQIEVQS